MGFKPIDPASKSANGRLSGQQNKQSNRKRSPAKKRWLIALGVGLAVISVLLGIGLVKQSLVNKTSARMQHDNFTKKADIALMNELDAHQSTFAYGANNHGIPNAHQLKKYAALPEKLYGRGYIAVPRQTGVSQPITALVINEGVSDKVLAVGAGTPRRNEMMGQGNFAVAAHNFGNNQTYFSPMQRRIDVNKQPKVYLTDGQQLYTYQFNKIKDQVSGRQVVSYKHGEVVDDAAGKGHKILTMITCDEPGVFNLHPENRLLLRATLLHVGPLKQADKPVQQLFPQLQER